MQIGIVGLGRMGANIACRLMRAGHRCVVYDLSADAVRAVVAEGAVAASDLRDLIAKLEPPRAAWVMLPAGGVTETAIADLASLMEPGDTVIDGGNSFWKDDVRRAAALAQMGLHYVDVGTSGGVWGLERGYCMMIGGEKPVVDRLDPIFAALAPGAGRRRRAADAEPGRARLAGRARLPPHRPNGSGHFMKMIHNGIEYGLMQVPKASTS